jgi:hypothetical protein
MSNDTKLEAKLHFFSISSFIGLEFSESGFSFEFGGGHTPPPLSCYTTLSLSFIDLNLKRFLIFKAANRRNAKWQKSIFQKLKLPYSPHKQK